MDMIIGEFTRWKDNHPRATFKSMKVIMCTPRSRPYPDFLIEDTMKECYEMKQEAKYKDWIAGKWSTPPYSFLKRIKREAPKVSHTTKTRM